MGQILGYEAEAEYAERDLTVAEQELSECGAGKLVVRLPASALAKEAYRKANAVLRGVPEALVQRKTAAWEADQVPSLRKRGAALYQMLHC